MTRTAGGSVTSSPPDQHPDRRPVCGLVSAHGRCLGRSSGSAPSHPGLLAYPATDSRPGSAAYTDYGAGSSPDLNAGADQSGRRPRSGCARGAGRGRDSHPAYGRAFGSVPRSAPVPLDTAAPPPPAGPSALAVPPMTSRTSILGCAAEPRGNSSPVSHLGPVPIAVRDDSQARLMSRVQAVLPSQGALWARSSLWCEACLKIRAPCGREARPRCGALCEPEVRCQHGTPCGYGAGLKRRVRCRCGAFF